MKLALSKTERNLDNVPEPWREKEEEEEEEEQKPPPHFLITSNKARPVELEHIPPKFHSPHYLWKSCKRKQMPDVCTNDLEILQPYCSVTMRDPLRTPPLYHLLSVLSGVVALAVAASASEERAKERECLLFVSKPPTIFFLLINLLTPPYCVHFGGRWKESVQQQDGGNMAMVVQQGREVQTFLLKHTVRLEMQMAKLAVTPLA
eukprot:superscaffoldBa00002819_g15372